MSQDAFKKFANQKKNSKVKEEFRQEKKRVKKERAAFFEKLKEEKFQAKKAKFEGKPVPIKTAPAKKINQINEAPLNKYLAHCGISSRRDAAEIIKDGKVKVNQQIISEPGYKVQPNDEVVFNNKKVFITKNLVYILLNLSLIHI